MKKTTAAIVALVSALVISNAWWLFVVVDAAHAYSDLESSLRLNEAALNQSLAIIKASADQNITQEQVVSAAIGSAGSPNEPFEKDGFLWVGSIGLRFSDTGRLLEAVPSWSDAP